MIKKMLSSYFGQRQDERKTNLYRDLIHREAKIGGELFGPIPDGHRREFFCLDEHTWVWHEEWLDENKMRHHRTTRYDIRPNGILKAQDGRQYQNVGYDEAKNLFEAAKRYRDQVHQQLYPFVT